MPGVALLDSKVLVRCEYTKVSYMRHCGYMLAAETVAIMLTDMGDRP